MADFSKVKEDIIKRAGIDSSFRDELVNDPKGTIEKYFPNADGKKIPEKMNIVVCEDRENTVFINVSSGDVSEKLY